jgi:hypothetical protein
MQRAGRDRCRGWPEQHSREDALRNHRSQSCSRLSHFLPDAPEIIDRDKNATSYQSFLIIWRPAGTLNKTPRQFHKLKTGFSAFPFRLGGRFVHATSPLAAGFRPHGLCRRWRLSSPWMHSRFSRCRHLFAARPKGLPAFRRLFRPERARGKRIEKPPARAVPNQCLAQKRLSRNLC